MKNLAEMLKPIVVATKLVQRGRHTPISVVIPLYKVILRELSAEASLERSARDAVAEGLRRRVEEERYEDREEFVIATMVDPRFKDSYFANEKKDMFLAKIEELALQVTLADTTFKIFVTISFYLDTFQAIVNVSE